MDFVVEDFNSKITSGDLACNAFGGNSGNLDVNGAPGSVTGMELVGDRNGGQGRSLRLHFNFNAAGSQVGGRFMSLLGLTDTKVSLDGSGIEPSTTTHFPGYHLDFDDFYKGFGGLDGRSIEAVAFDAKRSPASAALTVKVEFKDAAGRDVFRRVQMPDDWTTIRLERSEFDSSNSGVPALFDWKRVEMLSFLVEESVTGQVSNVSGSFDLDDVRLVDLDGYYPDYAAAAAGPLQQIRPEYQSSFLDHIRKLSCQYFEDFASTDSRTGGMIQDRSSFADLMTTGGILFQVASYVTASENGWRGRTEIAGKVAALLRHLAEGPQGPGRVGTTGYQGWFYHFFGPDGRRKMNFDFNATLDVNESWITVELSTIDTALALAGVTIAREYFNGGGIEEQIRTDADLILGRVNWPFMLAELSGGKRQFYLGWKPLEDRFNNDTHGRFELLDASGLGQYSSKNADGSTVPATLDFFTTEGQLVALLAMSCPNPEYRIGREVWDDMAREGGEFVKTYPGSIFTYTWLEHLIPARRLGADNHPALSVDWHENTRLALSTIRQQAIQNPLGIASLAHGFTGVQPCEGPWDRYWANSVTGASLSGDPPSHYKLEWESAAGAGSPTSRGNASGGMTRRLTQSGDVISTVLSVPATTRFKAVCRYSNDGPEDLLRVKVNGQQVLEFTTLSTGSGGHGWNQFTFSAYSQEFSLTAGQHDVELEVVSTDTYGVEPDALLLFGPPETGTLTPYGTAEQMRHFPQEVIAELYKLATFDLFADGRQPLLHPRMGFVDAFQTHIEDALVPWGIHSSETSAFHRTTGPWCQPVGFSIDHGPLLLSISNWLDDDLIPALFCSNPGVAAALDTLFPQAMSAYDLWRKETLGSLNSPETEPFADFDHDGIANVIAFFAGLRPFEYGAVFASLTPLPSASGPAEILVHFSHDRRALGLGLPDFFQSGDLLEWTQMQMEDAFLIPALQGREWISWRISLHEGASRLFFHSSFND